MGDATAMRDATAKYGAEIRIRRRSLGTEQRTPGTERITKNDKNMRG